MDICHLKNAELEPKFQKYKGRLVLRGDIVKNDSGPYAVFTEQGSSASQMTAAKVMDVMSRLSRSRRTRSWCHVSIHPGKIGGCSKIALNSKIRMSRNMDTSSTTQICKIMGKYWRFRCSSWQKLIQTPTCWIVVGEAIRRRIVGISMGKSTELEMFVCS